MVASTEDRHDFVVGFADALTRLAYLLTVTGDADTSESVANAQRRADSALAQAIRRWHDVQAAGAPEPVAVEALLNRLPHRRHRPPVAKLVATAANDPTIPDDENSDGDIDARYLHDATWRAWITLPERQRVPFVFAELSPVSRRLDGLELPDGFASPHRLETLYAQALSTVKAALAADPRVAFVPDGRELDALVAETLVQHAYDASPAPDPFANVVDIAHRSRRRGLAAAAAALVAIAAVAVTVTVTSLSTSKDSVQQAAARSTGSVSPSPRVSLNDSAAQHGKAAVANWPTRGTLKDDANLIANVRSAFVDDHIDATGQVSVLLATDTPWFRVAYVTAQTPTGVLHSWFYGPVGSTNLVEGNFSYAGGLGSNQVAAAAVADTVGHQVLVVIAPPTTSQASLAGLQVNAPLDRFVNLPAPDGIVVDDISGAYVPALQLVVFADSGPIWEGQISTVQLAATFGFGAPTASAAPTTGTASSSGVPAVTPSATSDRSTTPVVVERGSPDPNLLATALAAERQYVVTGTVAASGMPVVVWAGTDSSGTAGVLVRAKTLHLSDLLVAVWANAPGTATGYRLAPDAPDAPIVFQYEGVAGASVGVVAPHGITQVGLVVDGADIGVSQVGGDGFATLLVGQQYGVLAEQTLAVDLFDANGRQISREPVTLSS